MANDKQSSVFDLLQSKSGLGALAICFSLIGSLLPHTEPFIEERPASSTSSGNGESNYLWQVEEGKITSEKYFKERGSRLWQDPFEETGAAATSPVAYDITQYPRSANGSLTIHAAPRTKSGQAEMMSGATLVAGMNFFSHHTKRQFILAPLSTADYAEETEKRRRSRYALVQAMAQEHYYPIETEKIAWFRLELKKYGNATEAVKLYWEEFRFVTDGSKKCSQETEDCSSIVVLWVPAQRLQKIVQTINKPELKTKLLVLGPNESDRLKELVWAQQVNPESSDTENVTDGQKINRLNPYLTYITSGASIDSCFLLGLPNKKELDACILGDSRKLPSNILRATSPDNLVIDQLVKELELRGVSSKEGQHIALISDLDTEYARALTHTFKVKYENDASEVPACKQSKPCEPFTYQFNYIRGVDGRVAANSGDKSKSKEGKENDASSNSKSSGQKSDGTANDRPEGNSQRDYARRLAEHIRNKDRELRLQEISSITKRKGIAAIGVLGNDVYDKIMILQSLHSLLPDKIFFTTDLDSAYSIPREIKHTRNLIVGSSFGLALADNIQTRSGPFRNSDQTAYFHAALLAIKKSDSFIQERDTKQSLNPQTVQWQPECRSSTAPHIYEIGLEETVNLGSPAGNTRVSDTCSLAIDERSLAKTPSGSSNPSLKDDNGNRVKLWLSWTVSGLVLIWLCTLEPVLLRQILSVLLPVATQTKLINRNLLALLTASIAFTVGIAAYLIFLTYVSKIEEPFDWFNGTSIWPSTLLRLLSFLMSISLIVIMFTKIKAARACAKNQFGLAPDRTNTTQAGFFRIISDSWKIFQARIWIENPEDKKEVSVAAIWKRYLEQSALSRIWLRETFIVVVLLLLITFICIDLLSEIQTPVRGELSRYIGVLVSGAAFLSALILTALVADTLRQFYHFSKDLNRGQSNWGLNADVTRSRCIAQANLWELPEDFTAYWVDIQFIAHQTEMLGALVWYPMLSWILLLAARNPIFDNWGYPIGLMVGYGLIFFWLIHTAFYLQRSATTIRSKALRILSEKYMNLVAKGRYRQSDRHEFQLRQAEKMIAEIRDMKRGAFLPLFQQPWMEALLALVGSQAILSALTGHFG